MVLHIEVLDLAYELAIKNKLKISKSWIEKQAGVDWLYGYLKWHPELSIKKPEPTSVGCATDFNKTTVGEFFENLTQTLVQLNHPYLRIYIILMRQH